MARSKQSQWDFGELFVPDETRDVLTVSELTSRVKGTLESEVGQVWVEGEITNLRAQASGHMYFSIKDERTQLSCVLFRGARTPQRELIEDGQKVLLHGDLTVYEVRGQYQLIVQKLELQGVGELQMRFEKLKEKLHSEGLFEQERKRPLPKYPQRIGVVTSLGAAALSDVLHVVRRRHSSLEIVIAASRVQGQGAEMELALGVEWLNRFAQEERIDLILLTRGGGSLEDLWAFNEEILARAIAESVLPVVSAVGHEIDFTISDFVADVRAATPSAAVEIITADIVALQGRLGHIGERLSMEANRMLQTGQVDFEHFSARLGRCHPRKRLQEQMQRVDELGVGLQRVWHMRWTQLGAAWKAASSRLRRVRPRQALIGHNDKVSRIHQRLEGLVSLALKRRHEEIKRLSDRLRLLGPDNVLARGYSITMDEKSGMIVRNTKAIKKGQRLCTRVVDGKFSSTVD